MGYTNRRKWLFTIPFLAAFLLVAVANVARLFRPPYLGSKHQRKRIDDLIELIGSSSFERALEMACTREEFYTTPGFMTQRDYRLYLVELTLSNRWCIRVLNDIENMDNLSRETKLRSVFDFAFTTHMDAISSLLSRMQDADSKLSGQSLMPTRQGVCLALLATAEFGSTEDLLSRFRLLQEFEDSVDERLKLHEGNRGAADVVRSFVRMIRLFGFIDEREELNILNIHRVKLGRQLSKRLEGYLAKCIRSDVEVVPWDAHTTYFDHTHVFEHIPIDVSRGVKRYTLYEWPSEDYKSIDLQRELIQEMRNCLA